jgi:hypothetical protein
VSARKRRARATTTDGRRAAPTVAEIYGGAVAVDVDAERLRPSLAEVALHAGGPRFGLSDEMAATVRALIDAVAISARPHIAHAARRVERVSGRALVLEGGPELPIADLVAAAAAGVVGAVCTLGPEVDALRDELGLDNMLDAWLLDATQLAVLDLLEDYCFQHVAQRAATAGLCVGTALVPGVGGVPDTTQRVLLDLLGAAAAPVGLNRAGAMTPLKSFSCWLPLVGEADARDGLHLCESCDLPHCSFKRTNPRATVQRLRDGDAVAPNEDREGEAS